MKSCIFLKLATLSLLAAVAITGCKKTPKNVTPIFGAATRVGPADGRQNALTNLASFNPEIGIGSQITNRSSGNTETITNPPVFPPGKLDGTNGAGQGGPEIIDGYQADRLVFAASTIHFDYDKAILKAAELGKLQPVIAALKGAPQNKLRVEGHCDERGTEEYNRALGERRALAIRTQLIKSGIAPNCVTTTSFGEDKPAALGHDDAAWAKNRRGELILLKP